MGIRMNNKKDDKGNKIGGGLLGIETILRDLLGAQKTKRINETIVEE